MGIIFNFINCLRKYCNFSGRSSRYEYWSFTLVYALLSLLVQAMDSIFGMRVLVLLFGLAMLLPSWGVAVRRLHDVNRSGWWLLLPSVITVVGAIISKHAGLTDSPSMYIFIMVAVIISSFVILYWFIKKGDETSNDYGNP